MHIVNDWHRTKPNMSLHPDKQHPVAASRRVLNAGGLQR